MEQTASESPLAVSLHDSRSVVKPFYRLFGSVQDVLVYECDKIFNLFATHMRNKDLIRTIFIRDTAISDNDADFLISILSGMIPSVIHVWYEHGQIETAEELFCTVRKSAHIIDAVMNGE